MPYADEFDLDAFLAYQPLPESDPGHWNEVPMLYDRCAASPEAVLDLLVAGSTFTVPPSINPLHKKLELQDQWHISNEWKYAISRITTAREATTPACKSVTLLANPGCGAFVVDI